MSKAVIHIYIPSQLVFISKCLTAAGFHTYQNLMEGSEGDRRRVRSDVCNMS